MSLNRSKGSVDIRVDSLGGGAVRDIVVGGSGGRRLGIASIASIVCGGGSGSGGI
jgi:hypothetical protein